MKKRVSNKTIGFLLSLVTLGAVVFAAIQTKGSFTMFNRLKADGYNVTLNKNNSPTITNGDGTYVDERGITWEYHNASNYASGHITLNADGYLGVSSSTAYGFTGIERITTSFSGSELWLLKSVDGIEWHECETLTSGQDTYSANDWRYVRFYNYSSTININSISINYSCSGISATEDVDNAHSYNVIATTGLDYASETIDISPKSVGGEAVRFTKPGTGSTDLTIGFDRAYTLGETAYSKIEFDINTSNINYGRTIEVLNTDGSYTSTKVNTNNTNSYVWTSLGNNWYHVELPITTIVSLISGYDKKDIPTKNIDKKTFNAIKINAGACIIDNLRIGSSECNLGIYNSSTYQPSIGEIYWVKTSWVGVLYAEDVEITFSDDTLARCIPLTDPNLKNGSPFYIELLDSGTLTIYVSVVCGYNHRTQTISKTITVK